MPRPHHPEAILSFALSTAAATSFVRESGPACAVAARAIIATMARLRRSIGGDFMQGAGCAKGFFAESYSSARTNPASASRYEGYPGVHPAAFSFTLETRLLLAPRRRTTSPRAGPGSSPPRKSAIH